jgi:cytidylate kinase
MYLNGNNVEKQIRTLAVSKLVSKVAKISEVRRKLVAEQQEMGKEKGIVMDGRDIGTVVFPDAELKLFMTASADKRADRRFTELSGFGEKVSYQEILQNVIERDSIDSTRKDSPLVKADDAIQIDNTEMTIEEQYSKILKLVNEKI